MYLKYYWLFILVLAVAGCSSVPKPKPIPTGSLGEFQKKAEKFNEIVTVPVFETTPDEIAATATNVITAGNAALDRIGGSSPAKSISPTRSGRWMTLAIRFKRLKTGWN